MFQAQNTMEQRYLSSLKFFNQNVQMYLDAYDKATPEVQKKWKTNIDPIIEKASTTLDLWGTAIGTDTAETKEQAWNIMKDQFIRMLISFEIIKIGE